MLDAKLIDALGESLFLAGRTRKVGAPLTELHPAITAADAYRIQHDQPGAALLPGPMRPGNAYLRHLTTIGAILGGKCWADPELNTPDQISQGKVYFDFDFTPPFPAEHITFRSQMVNDYLTEIF